MKRVPALRALSDDHHAALVIARRCRQAKAPAAALWAKVREAFAGHLEPHFTIEDRHLLPALVAIGEAPLAERLRADHAELRALAAETAADLATVQRFGERLAAHVRFEERDVFEPTQERLPAAALAAIDADCRAIPRRAPAF